ncbi:MAG: DNA polymerase/3'-5' exonuclease PolX [bacterium]|nr:DNA polymerase/3'-5' exonuclease PolX [bacterium]
MDNITIAKTFSAMADMLEIVGENRFRVNAYRRAAETVEASTHDVCTRSKKQLMEIPGIGEDLSDKIIEMSKTGVCKECEQLKKKVPEGLLEVLRVESIGPKTARLLWKKFRVVSMMGLERLLSTGKLEGARGFGVKKVANFKRGLEIHERFRGRQPLGYVLPLAEKIIQALRTSKLCEEVEIAGSLRRGKETVGDIDILVTSREPQKAMDFFVVLPQIKMIEQKGETKARVILTSGIACDFRVVAPEAFGAALYYFTGSKEHNVQARTMAVKNGLTVNEYGVFKVQSRKSIKSKVKNVERVAGKTEEEVMRAIGLPWIPPELREDRGEIEAALVGKLPKLIEEKYIRGNLHMHSNWSDGEETMEAMVRASKRKGYEYVALTDHASSMGMVKGTKEHTVDRYIRMVRAVEKKVGGIHVLAGAEVDIEKDGSLYLSDKSLAKLDFVVASMHLYLKQDRATATKRLIRAMENPYVDCIGHCTSRSLGKREPMDLDMEAVMKAAKRTGTIMELNAHWVRLDLNDIHARLAKEYGVTLSISTDAHTVVESSMMRYGIVTARRAWIEKKNVINTLPWKEFQKMLY